MVKNNCSSHRHRNLGRTVALCVVMALLSVSIQAPHVYSENNPSLVLSPEFEKYLVGENFTVTVSLTNAHDLFSWEIVLKYNTTILSLTSVWIPTDNVFAGHATVQVEPKITVDTSDGMNFTDYGLSLIGIDEIATVTNAVLFDANFTVVGVGQGSITTATTGSPAMSSRSASYSFIGYVDQYGYLEYFQDFTVETSTILSGILNAIPSAEFTIGPPPAGVNNTKFIVDDNPPSGVFTYQLGYEGIPVLFNASLSYDPDGYITQYIWNFGDQNVTVNVNYNATGNATIDIPAGTEAALEAAAITHVYDAIGPYGVKLVVVDNGIPGSNATALASLPTSPHYILIGLDLDYYDWNPFLYGVIAIIAVLIVLYAARKIVSLSRERRARIAAKKTTGPAGSPPSTTGPQRP